MGLILCIALFASKTAQDPYAYSCQLRAKDAVEQAVTACAAVSSCEAIMSKDKKTVTVEYVIPVFTSVKGGF